MCARDASRNDLVINAAFDGSSRPFTCTITIPFRPELGGATTRGAEPAIPAHETRAASTSAAVAGARSRTWGAPRTWGVGIGLS